MKKQKHINEKGFSLVETMIAVTVSAALIFAVLLWWQNFQKGKGALEATAEQYSVDSTVKRFLFDDLGHSATSFYLFTDLTAQTDGDDCAGIDNLWQLASGIADCSLEFELNPSNELWLLRERSNSKAMIFSPKMAYKTNPDLTYSPTDFKNYITSQGSWYPGSLVKLESTTRPRDTNGNMLNYSILVKQVDDNSNPLQLYTNADEGFNKLLPPNYSTHCDKGSYSNAGIDLFLRCPPSTGSVSLIRLIPVSLIRYRVENSTEYEGLFDLYRAKVMVNKDSGATSIIENRIATKVKKLIFFRTSITSPMISFQFEMALWRNLKKL
ncbi:MAG: prepilin-type N-terminal cleavage/methylation domain-containing protein [Bacteriovoracaceae bacterium]|nr:prepilin-type N-terminal cleavage/methylation domain-containing protein [Bacteriovoracaceae bacterium]